MATFRYEIEVEVLDDEEYGIVMDALMGIGAEIRWEKEVIEND